MGLERQRVQEDLALGQRPPFFVFELDRLVHQAVVDETVQDWFGIDRHYNKP